MNKGDAVHGKGGLQCRHLEELVEHHVGVEIALHVDDDAHTVLVALVVHVRYALDSFFCGQHADVFHQFLLVQSVGQFAHHDGVVRRSGFDFRFGAHHDPSASGFVGSLHALHAHDVASGGEVGCFHVVHQPFGVDVRIVDESHAAVNHFSQVVRGHIRGHTHGNAAGTVHQEVGDARRHHGGFVERVVKVAVHVHRFLVEVLHHGFAHLGQSGFRVTHGSGRVAVHGAEVALSVHQCVAHVPGLGHTDQCAVNRAVAVRMVFTKHVAHDTGRLSGRFVVCDAQAHHAVEDASVNGFETVAHVGQGACHND